MDYNLINRYEKVVHDYCIKGCVNFPNLLGKNHIKEITDISGYIKHKDGVCKNLREQNDVIVTYNLTEDCLYVSYNNDDSPEFIIKIQYIKN